MKNRSQSANAELVDRLRPSPYNTTMAVATGKQTVAGHEPVASALHDSEARLRAILETAVEGIITIDERGIIESFNPAAARIFGCTADEVLGKNVTVLMPSPYREEHDAYLAQYLRTGKARIIGIGREVTGRRKDGTVFPMGLSVSEVRLAGRRLFAGFVRDVSERNRLEREILEISDREQSRIGQDLHDGLCQHLAGIELMSQVLEQKLKVKSKGESKRAGEIAKRVREAIGQTRLLARGLSPVMLESEGLMFALQELAMNSENLFGVACTFECEAPVLEHDIAVATHLYRIAQEAVSNAIKHGKARHITIRLKSVGERNVLVVKDDGVGLPKVPPKTKGMGLRIMQYRAAMVGGALMVERDLNGGTSVVCSVPQAAGPMESARK